MNYEYEQCVCVCARVRVCVQETKSEVECVSRVGAGLCHPVRIAYNLISSRRQTYK